MCSKAWNILLTVVASMFLTSCFTGVENTKKITSKDVEKALSTTAGEHSLVEIRRQDFKDWQEGKRFKVTDNNLKLLLTRSFDYNLDTLQLKGKELTYAGYDVNQTYDGRKEVSLKFHYGSNVLKYNTHREETAMGGVLSIPSMVEMDEVELLHKQIAGKKYFIRTANWTNAAGEAINGRKYVEVRIDSVLAGDKNFPLQVAFTDLKAKMQAYVLISDGTGATHNRSFEKFFSSQDLRKSYPNISDEVWALIEEGKIREYMTKEECRLSIGNPNSVDQRNNYSNVQEMWTYSDGAYLMFEDGILKRYRR